LERNGHAEGVKPRVGFAERTPPGLTRETEQLLQRRLRLAALLMFFGFLAFLVKHLTEVDLSTGAGRFLAAFHVVVVVVLGVLSGALCRRCELSERWLRPAELLMFGTPAAFFLAVQYYSTLECCARGFFDFRGETWLLLIFTYALFIPNTLRRAAVVIAVMALAPLVLLGVMIWLHAPVAELTTRDDAVWLGLMLTVAAVTGVFGVDTIGSLRREAFEARQIGQYRLVRRIGAGGMGEVHLAEHLLLKRPCVVKLIRPDKAGDETVLARFQREVQATARLSHWNTVEIFDYGRTEDGTFYYVMEYLPGMSLRELVDRYGPLPAGRVIYLLRQACDALREAHAMGLIHRDIKPGNIFVARRGGIYDVVKLLDFGLVKPVKDEQPVELTGAGVVAGSPLFMSPEQASGDSEADARSDIYSMGAVAYFLLTGRPPFEGDKPVKVMAAHIHQPVRRPSEICPDVPADLEAVVLRCLAKSPAERYPDVIALDEALAACEAAGQWSRQQAARWWRREPQCTAPA